MPTFNDADDSNTDSRSWETERDGAKLFHVEGEFWRDEWIPPADASPRVRGDKLPAACSFIVDASGTRQSADELNNEDIGRWLWFEPGVIGALANRRGASLSWHTRETGTVAASPGNGVHFGINTKGLITVYAYDVARLPIWQQRIWMGFNISPDGKVSTELLSSQMEAKPARTLAPEAFLERALARLDAVFRERWRVPLLLEHQDTPEIICKANRFRSTDLGSLLALAKDLARLTADSIDLKPLHAIVPLAKDERRGSLKSLERVLATIVSTEEARRVIGPLVGVYNLRVGDAHLASSKMDEAFDLVGIDRLATPLQQGFQLLYATVGTLVAIASVIETASPVASDKKE